MTKPYFTQLKYLLFLMISITQFSCKKDVNDFDGMDLTDKIPPGIYVCGYSMKVDNSTIGYVWKGDGTTIFNKNGAITEITSQGRNIYVLGYSGNERAYWKNNQRIILEKHPLGYPDSRNIFVTPTGDVYVSGDMSLDNGKTSQQLYWKNGKFVNNIEGINGAYRLQTFGNDVYILAKQNGHDIYCKNGNCTPFPADAYLSKITVSGSDVYLLGSVYNRFYNEYSTVYWKNGEPTTITVGNTITILDIFAKGADLYLLGTVNSVDGYAFYSKNGVTFKLEPNVYQDHGFPKGIYVDDNNDVYVSGSARAADVGSRAVLWKNGKLNYLSNEYSAGFGLTAIK